MNYKKMHEKDVFTYAAYNEYMFERVMMECGHERLTTFFSDLSIAEWCEQESGVRDTYERVMKEWISNIEYITEFSICLNHKIWQHYEHNDELAKLYNDLWAAADAWAVENLTGDELAYFYNTTD